MALSEDVAAHRDGARTALLQCLRRFVHGQATGEELTSEFGRSVLLLKRPERPGVLLRRGPEGPYLPVYSSEGALGRSEGQTGWFSASGATVLGLVPPGCAVVVDPGSDHAVMLPASAIADPSRREGSGEQDGGERRL